MISLRSWTTISIPFENHKWLKDDDDNAYLRKAYDLPFANVLYGVQIRSSGSNWCRCTLNIVTIMKLRYFIVTLIQYW
jgi:hypothetical protein